MRTHSDLGLKSLVPIVISGVLAIYGLIIGVILTHKFDDGTEITETDAYRFLAAGLAVGFSCLCSGAGIGIFLNAHHGPPLPPPGPRGQTPPPLPSGVDAAAVEPLLGHPPSPPPGLSGKSFVTMVLVLIFLEAIGLYGLVVALFAIGK